MGVAPLVQVADVTKTYYLGTVPVHAVRGVSFTVETGAFVVLMGRSGSGESTLIHQLGLIDTPTSGDILIEGVSVLKLTSAEKSEYRLKHFGHIFQEYALIAELTALENVALPGIALSGDFSMRKAKELLTLVELGDRMGHYPHELSGGEQQRVAIARALVNEPKILFADEPTANLDSVSAKVILDLFRQLNKERGQTVFMITHEKEDTKYADRVITLKDGLIAREK